MMGGTEIGLLVGLAVVAVGFVVALAILYG